MEMEGHMSEIEKRIQGGLSPDSKRKLKARKFYEMSPDFRVGGVPGWKLENEEFIKPKGVVIFARDSSRPGFPDFPEPPRFVVDKKLGRPPRDLEEYGYWVVSDRMKRVLEEIDPRALAFVRCDVRRPGGELGPAYWLCDVLPILDAVDEAASKVRVEYDGERKVYSLMGGANLIFKDDIVEDHHIFRLTPLRTANFCDNQIRDACKAAGLKGITFHDAADTNRLA